MSNFEIIFATLSGFIILASIFVLPFYFLLKIKNTKQHKGKLYLISLLLSTVSNYIISPIVITILNIALLSIINLSTGLFTSFMLLEMSIIGLATSYLLLKFQYSKVKLLEDNQIEV